MPQGAEVTRQESRRILSMRLQALLKHNFGTLRRFFLKLLWRDRLFPLVWPGIAVTLGAVASFSREVTPATCNPGGAVLLCGSDDGFATGRVAGQDLTRLTSLWLEETLGFQKVQSLTPLEYWQSTSSPDITVVSYDWLVQNIETPVKSAFRLAKHLRKVGSPAFVILPDGFWLRLTAFGSLIVALSGGSQIVLQDAVSSHKKFGTVRPTGPHFWTWPRSHVNAWHSNKPWGEREQLALVPSRGGGTYRHEVTPRIVAKLQGAGYETVSTGKGLDWDSYIDLNKRSRIVVTTCQLQSEYLIGPRSYRAKLPTHLITGRVWEAFASGNLLVTDISDELAALGFAAGEHYWPLPNGGPAEWDSWRLPAEFSADEIAANGRLRFLEITESAARPSHD